MPDLRCMANNMVDYVYEKECIVQYHEVDQHGFARPVALLNYLQSAAGEHATQLGVAVPDLRKSGHTWVLSRIHLVVDRYPRGGETFRIKTWPAAREVLFTVRDFELLDSIGASVGRATTSWAVLNIKTRRPVKLNDILPFFPVTPKRALNDPFRRLPALEKSHGEFHLPVLRGDLDINKHVNNTVYVGWALETIPEEIDNSCRLVSVEIAFRAEALYGDTIVAHMESTAEKGCCIHRIDSDSDGRELARLRTLWEPIV